MFRLFGQSEYAPFVCPRCGGRDHAVWKLPNVVLVHWLLNPGLVVNELLLGQRIPARTYFCTRCPGLMTERQFVYCHGCGEFQDGMIWSMGHAFGHWLGLICPDCGCRIPSLLNVTSWLVLARISPICWVLSRCFGKRYQKSERARALRAKEALTAKRRTFESG